MIRKYKDGLCLLAVLCLTLVAQSMTYYDEVDNAARSCAVATYAVDNKDECNDQS